MVLPLDGPDLGHWQGEPVPVWESLWGVPRLEAWSSLASTNDRARSLAAAGAPAWTVVTARRQTAGRGRSGRSWQSAPDAGLWVSVVTRPRTPAQAALLPLLAGLAVARAVEGGDHTLRVALKWPNDVFLEGRKIAGILCEAAGAAVVVGVGINLRAPRGGFEEAHAASAGSLEALTGSPWSEARLLGALIRELRALAEAATVRFDGAVAREWAERDILRGRAVRVGTVRGIVRGVGPDGALDLEQDDGTLARVRAGHVEWDGPGAGPR